MIRKAAVAGTFYPSSGAELGALVDRFLADSEPRGAAPKALIVPHAGYIYSGPIAATAFAQLAGSHLERVVIVGPAHRVAVEGLVSPGATHLATPLGEIEVDLAALRLVPEVTAHPAAHAREHSLEVMLPFIQRIAPRAKVVPIAASHASPEAVGRMIDALWGGPETAIVISSDLSHYLPYDTGRAIDTRTAARIVGLEAGLAGEDACGCTGINGLIWLARTKRKLRIELLDLRSSGDTAGRREEVVGYGAFAAYEVA